MSFIDLIRDDVCHPDALIVTPGPELTCRLCQRVALPQLYAYMNRPSRDYFQSSQLAQAYAAWTGDQQVPMSFPLPEIPGILNTIVVGQPIYRVRKSIRLLRALNAPFTTTHPHPTYPFEDMESFLAEFLNIVYEQPQAAETSDEQEALTLLIRSMHSVLSHSKNPFETYFSSLVPYVRACVPEWPPLPAKEEQANLAMELYNQLMESFQIRHVFSRYAIPFDVLHVMVACYACSSQMEVVGNWAIDFLARICRGQFFWNPECPFVQRMQQLVRAQFHYTSKENQYYKEVIRPIQRGESMHHYESLWYPLQHVQSVLKKKYSVPGVSPEIMDTAFYQCFPTVLFTDYADQLGFSIGFNHLMMSINRRNGMIPKGATRKAKDIHGMVQRFVKKMHDFESGGTLPIWNLDMLKLFFASDEHLHDEIKLAVRFLLRDEEE